MDPGKRICFLFKIVQAVLYSVPVAVLWGTSVKQIKQESADSVQWTLIPAGSVRYATLAS